MIKQGVRSFQHIRPYRSICISTTSTHLHHYHHHHNCIYTKSISSSTQQVDLSCKIVSTIIKQQQQCKRNRSPTPNRCTQLRFLGLNPYDDDDDVDTTESNIQKVENKDATSQNSIDEDEYEDDDYEDEDDYDDISTGSDSVESSQVAYNPTRNIKKYEVPEGPVPSAIIFQKTGKETFFQFDYRNAPPPANMKPNLASLLEKIQITLKDTEYEPYHNRRGCETLRTNIQNLPDGTKFRVGGAKKSAQKVGDGYDKAVNVTTHRALRKSMFYLLWERHAIMTSGTTHDWKKLSSKAIGQSLLGPETRVVVDQRLGKEIIQELWIRGVSSKFNRLIKRHNDRSADNNYLQYLKPEPSKKKVARTDWDFERYSTEKLD